MTKIAVAAPWAVCGTILGMVLVPGCGCEAVPAQPPLALAISWCHVLISVVEYFVFPSSQGHFPQALCSHSLVHVLLWEVDVLGSFAYKILAILGSQASQRGNRGR